MSTRAARAGRGSGLFVAAGLAALAAAAACGAGSLRQRDEASFVRGP